MGPPPSPNLDTGEKPLLGGASLRALALQGPSLTHRTTLGHL